MISPHPPENYTTAIKFYIGNLPDNKTFQNLLMNTKQILTIETYFAQSENNLPPMSGRPLI